MERIQAILFDPVGCLAEFPVAPFQAIAAEWLPFQEGRTASEIYWEILGRIEQEPPAPSLAAAWEELECAAAADASIYEDVVPALSELRELGVTLAIASSLSAAALDRFIGRGLASYFSQFSSRTSTNSVGSGVLRAALEKSGMIPANTLYLTDTAQGLHAGRAAGLQPILMMNDPDRAMKLTEHKPAGGIVSLYELPDFVRLVSGQYSNNRG